MSRRGSRWLALAMVLCLWGSLSCQRTPDGNGQGREPAVPVLHYLTWSDYVSRETITEFEQVAGARVIVDTFASNEELLAKLQGGASGYDVAVPSDFMVTIMAAQGLLAELDAGAIPNVASLEPHLQHPAFDPSHRYSLPYFWGTVGIGYDSAVLAEAPESWEALWDERYRGKISMLNDTREVFGAALRSMGRSMNTTDPVEIEAAKQKLIRQKPLVKTYASEHYDQLLASGDVVLAHGWGGQVARAMADRPSIRYVVPKEGATMWTDCLVVLKSSNQYPLALRFLNYLIDARVAAKSSERLLFASSNRESRAFVKPAVLGNPAVYPPVELLPRLEWMTDVGRATRHYDRAWTELKMR